MKRKSLALFAALLVSVLLINLASSEIIISQLKNVYSSGDELAFDAKLDAIKQGYFDVSLVCNSAEESLYHSVPDSTTISIKRQLTPVYIKNLSGSCSISAVYGGISINSQAFELNKEIIVELVSNNLSYRVGENLIVSGKATKKNGQVLGAGNAGFVEISINGLVVSDAVKDGKFSVSIKIPENFKQGSYALEAKTFDKDNNGNLLNEGKAYDSVNIVQLPSKTEAAIDKQSLVPGENLNIIPLLYDRAGDIMAGQLLMSIKDAKDNILFEGYAPVNENFTLASKTNSAPGKAKIIVQKDNITSEKIFEITELKKLKVSISNRTMTIFNVGNIAYKGIVEITISNEKTSEKILKELDIEIGENKTFEISAPDGIYDITIKDENELFTQSGVSLTGNAISIVEARDKLINVFSHYPIVWVFIVVILIIGLFVFYKNYRTKRKFHFSPYEKIKSQKNEVRVISPETIAGKVSEVIDKEILKGDIRKAEQTTILHGLNQKAGIVAIKLKSSIGGIVKESLNKALEYAYSKKGVSCSSGDYILLIFSPLLTKTSKNEETAIKAAIDIDNYLREHNRKFRNDIINYGIGVNSGEIINNLSSGVLQFASINKTISYAKRIAELANQQVLLSQEIHEKTMNNIKAEKVASGSMNLFAVKRIVDTEKAKQFINEFMRRN